MQQSAVPRCAIRAREASGSETPRVHNVARWCSRVAACGARAAGRAHAARRILAEGLHSELGQPIVVENVGGAGGMTGVNRVAKAAC